MTDRTACTLTACCLALALVLMQGCASTPADGVTWTDITDKQRDHAQLQTDYSVCLWQRDQPAQIEQPVGTRQALPCYGCVTLETAPNLTGDTVKPVVDDAFVECMRLRGWQPAGAATPR